MVSRPGEAPGETVPSLLRLPFTVPAPLSRPVTLTLPAVTEPPFKLSTPGTVITWPAALIGPVAEPCSVPLTVTGPSAVNAPPAVASVAPAAMLVEPDTLNNAPGLTVSVPLGRLKLPVVLTVP